MQVNSKKLDNRNNTIKRSGLWALVVAAVLLIPFLTKASWTGSDYVFAGTVLLACAFVYEYATRKSNNTTYKVAVGAGILFFIFLVVGWAASGP